MISFVGASILTTVASMVAAWLDACLLDEETFFPKRLQTSCNKHRDPSTMTTHKRWRNVLDRLILALADQQLLTGLAILVAGYIKESENLAGAHFTLIVYMSFLSSSTHLASIITLRKYLQKHPITSNLRICLVLIFACALIISTVLASAFGPFLFAIGTVIRYLPGPDLLLSNNIFGYLPVIWLFWTALFEVSPQLKSRLKALLRERMWRSFKRVFRLEAFSAVLEHFLGHSKSNMLRRMSVMLIRYCVFSSPGSIFILQVVLAMSSAGIALAQKFAVSSNTALCTLRSSDEDSWGFGQVLPILLLWLPLFSALEVFIGRSLLLTPSTITSLHFLRGA